MQVPTHQHEQTKSHLRCESSETHYFLRYDWAPVSRSSTVTYHSQTGNVPLKFSFRRKGEPGGGRLKMPEGRPREDQTPPLHILEHWRRVAWLGCGNRPHHHPSCSSIGSEGGALGERHGAQ